MSDNFEYDRRRRRGILPQIKSACRLLIAFTFSHVGVCGLVVGYIIFGAFLFQYIESKSHMELAVTDKNVRQQRAETAQTLLDIMLKFQINMTAYLTQVDAALFDYTTIVVKAIREEGYDGEVPQDPNSTGNHSNSSNTTENIQWGFSGAFLYSLTVITTIGYGNVAPLTTAGKLTTIVYGIIGMPLFLLYLSNVGDILARGFKWAFSKCCQCRWNCARRVSEERDDGGGESSPDPEEVRGYGGGGGEEEEEQITVPISVCLILMVAYIVGGGLWFSTSENWTLLDASYFCFISLSTIGFGDLVPGTSVHATKLQDAIQVPFIFCSVYLLLGMALIAMCFNLMQEEVIAKVRSCGRRLGCSS